MNKKILLGSVAVIMLLAIFVEVSQAQTKNYLGRMSAAGTTYRFTFSSIGDSYHTDWMGHDVISLADRNTYVMTLSIRCRVIIIVADCCIMGDTIAIFYPTSTTLLTSKTSPMYIQGEKVVGPGTFTFYVGYTKCPGGFPAGYYIWAMALPP